MLKIISEIGINWNGEFKYIEELIRQSAIGGADFAKFQLYTSAWLFGDDSRKKNELKYYEVKEIFDMCKHYGIEFMASVFDEEKFGWVESHVAYHKIASITLKNNPTLCKKIIAIGKPVYASLGKFNSKESLPYMDDNVSYLECVANYPTSYKNIKESWWMNPKVVGLSDHSYGIGNCLYSIAHGSKVIEKHFTLNKMDPSNRDHLGSMDLNELKQLREFGNQIECVSKLRYK